MDIFIIVPAYNEEASLPGTLERLSGLKDVVKGVIIVNDGSTDGTPGVVGRWASGLVGWASVVNIPHGGFAAAVKAGVAVVPQEGFFVVVMADGCDDLIQIITMASLIQDADVVGASRYLPGGSREGGPWIKALGSRVVNWVCAGLLSGRCHDATNSFKMYRKAILRDVPLTSRGFEISLEMAILALRYGARFVEIPTRWVERTQGRSKFSLLRHGGRYLLGILVFLRQVRT